MKNQVKKIVFILAIWILLLALILNIKNSYVYAQGLSLNISTDKTEYNIGEDVTIKMQFSEKIMTASFYLNYDSAKLQFKNVKDSNNVAVRNYESDGQLRVVYSDISGQGTDNIEFVFTTKEKANDTTYNVSNLTVSTAENSKTYKQSEIIINGNDSKINIVADTTNDNKNNIIENTENNNKKDTSNNIKNGDSATSQKSSNSNISVKNVTNDSTIKDTSTSNKALPKTGFINNNIFLYLIIAFIGISIYLGINLIKFCKYF